MATRIRRACSCNAMVLITASIGTLALVQIFQLHPELGSFQHSNSVIGNAAELLPPASISEQPAEPSKVQHTSPAENSQSEPSQPPQAPHPQPPQPQLPPQPQYEPPPLMKCNYSVASVAIRGGTEAAAAAAEEEEIWEAKRALGARRFRAGAALAVYVHIFKSGGTSVCAHVRRYANRWTRAPPEPAPGDVEAWEARDRRRRHRVKRTDPRPQGNCNAPPGFLPARGGMMHADVAEALGWQFVGVEFDGLPASDSDLVSPECALWSIQLRDPRDRFMSHFHHAQDHFRCLLKNVGRCAGPAHRWNTLTQGWGTAAQDNPNFKPLLYIGRGRRGPESFGSGSFSTFVRWLTSGGGRQELASPHPLAPMVSGDFAARHLCGFDACAPGECGDGCLDVAKRRLRHLFAAVLTTEGLSDWGFDAFHAAHGWPPVHNASAAAAAADNSSPEPSAAAAAAAAAATSTKHHAAGVYAGRVNSKGHHNRNIRNEGCGAKGGGCSAKRALDEGTYASLSRLLRVDMELYEYAKALAAERRKQRNRIADF